MSETYTPATVDIRNAYVWQRVGDDRSVSGTEANEEFTRWLATVTANPDDAAQVEVVARRLWRIHYGPIRWDSPYADMAKKRQCLDDARAVLAALAEAVGK